MDLAALLKNPDILLEDIDRLRCEDHLLPFVRRHWKVLEPVVPLCEGWPLEAICEHLEAVTDGEITRLLINVPPGFMKSLLTNCFWPAWEWGPQKLMHHRFVTFSYAASLTERDNGRFRDLLISPQFQNLWGKQFKLTKVGETKIQNNRTGWKFASSIGGVGTGERGNRILLDDPHNIKEGESDAVRQETCRWFRESMSNRLNDVSRDAIVIIMQRVHEADVSGEILSAGLGYEHLMIPMEWDQRRYVTSIGWTDPRQDDDDLAWPDRFPPKVVSDLKRDLGEYGYAAQYQQMPAPRGGGILKRGWWRRWDENECRTHGVPINHYPGFDYVIASLDTAYTERQENDYSALTVWGLWKDRRGVGRLMLTAAWEERLHLHDLVQRCLDTCRQMKVDRLLIEAKAAGHSAAQEIRRLMFDEIRSKMIGNLPTTLSSFGVELINPRGMDKVARAYSIAPLFEEGLIWAPGYEDGTWREWADKVITECAVFPKAAHDDLVDSVTQAIRYLRNIGLAERSLEAETRVKQSLQFKGRAAQQPLYPS